MRGRGWLRLRVVAWAICFALVSCGSGGDAPPGQQGEAGRSGGGTPTDAAERQAAAAKPLGPAPAFELRALGGEGRTALASLRGKTVVLDFWATWCPPCEFQVPELNAFFDAHREDSDVAVFGISIDVDPDEVVEAWTAEKGVRYPILMGSEDLARRYGAIGFPTLVVITPEGQIDERHVGLIEVADLERALERQRGH